MPSGKLKTSTVRILGHISNTAEGYLVREGISMAVLLLLLVYDKVYTISEV